MRQMLCDRTTKNEIVAVQHALVVVVNMFEPDFLVAQVEKLPSNLFLRCAT